MSALDLLPRVEVRSRAAWRAWLEEHHGTSDGIWLVTARKDSGVPAPSYDEVVIEALCFGWIDSRPRRLDETWTMRALTPRRAGSRWSARNRAFIEAALAEGIVAPAGLAAIARSRVDGTWDALVEVEALVVPDDLAAALAAQPPARELWDGFPRSARRGILEWIVSARRPETRARRVEETARLARDGIRANQWQPKQP